MRDSNINYFYHDHQNLLKKNVNYQFVYANYLESPAALTFKLSLSIMGTSRTIPP